MIRELGAAARARDERMMKVATLKVDEWEIRMAAWHRLRADLGA